MVETYLPAERVFDAWEEVMQALAEVELSWMEKILQEGRQEGMHTILIAQQVNNGQTHHRHC